jgi:predicted  nucleic acid-binding Zn-ribbon protein
MTVGPQGIDRLLELQELDVRADRLTARRAALEGGEEAAAARLRLSEAERNLGELRLAADEASREQRRLESDADGFQQKIAGEERRLFDGTVANPKELESIQHEITNLRNRKSRVEDEQLEVMERREDLETKAGAAEKAADEARAALTELQGSSEHELDDVGKELASLETERASLTPVFDPDLLELYEDLRRQKKGIGAAAMVDGVCQGCHQQLSAVELDRLRRTDGIRRCEHCRRILVF